MKVMAEKIDNHKLVLEIEVPQVEVAKAVNQAYKKLANEVNIPGFRKGKVPRKILEVRLGKETLMHEAFELLATKAYGEALEEQKIEPVSRPQVEVVTFEEDKPLVFKATVVPRPEITLGEYKGLKVAKGSVEVTAEEVTKQLETMRNRQAKMVVVEDAALENGDYAIIDFSGFIDGEPFKGGESKGYPLEVGSGSFIPGFEDQLLGAVAGEEREIAVTFPGDYQVGELAGKEAKFSVKVNDIKRKELPELDDEFVKEISEFDTLEELKANLENKLTETASAKAEQEFRKTVIQVATDNSSVDIPEVMVESRIDDMLQELDVNLQSRGMSLDKYLEFAKTDVATLRTNYRETALNSIKIDLMLEGVAKAEALEVTKEDLSAELAAMAQSYQVSPEQILKVMHQEGKLSTLKQSVLTKKALELIVAQVEV